MRKGSELAGPTKPVERDEWEGRLWNARDFKRDAENLIELRDDDENANGVITHVVNAAIAYADALTAKYGGYFNQQDHRAVRAAVERALGDRADPPQVKTSIKYPELEGCLLLRSPTHLGREGSQSASGAGPLLLLGGGRGAA